MNDWPAIVYREFYDVPRLFLTSYEGRQFLFDCAFDDELDDYPESYRVYLLSPIDETELEGLWDQLPGMAEKFLGNVRISQVQFDPSRRQSINPAVIRELLTPTSLVSKVA